MENQKKEIKEKVLKDWWLAEWKRFRADMADIMTSQDKADQEEAKETISECKTQLGSYLSEDINRLINVYFHVGYHQFIEAVKLIGYEIIECKEDK